MALIAICVHSTDENDRLKYTKECLESMLKTVDLNKHSLHIINNKSSLPTTEYLIDFVRNNNVGAFYNLKNNIGTAAGINLAIKERLPNQIVIKCDDDVVIHQSGWVEELEQAIIERPEIGICGLRREDVYGNFMADGKFLFGDDIMGTCTAFNPKLLDKIGYMSQPSKYGFDDNLISVRSLVTGFKNCFLPHIKITHLDDGKNPYSDWKKKEAAMYLQEVSIMCDMYKSGKLNPYYDGGFID